MLDLLPSPVAPRYAFSTVDEINIDGRRYVYLETRGREHVFFPADGNGPAVRRNSSQISRLLDKGKFEHKPSRNGEPAAETPPHILSLLGPEEKKRIAYREGFVLAFLEKYQAGEIKRTDNAIRTGMNDLRIRAGEFMQEGMPSGMAPTTAVPDACGPRSLRRWVKGYELFGMAALYDNVADRGNHDRRVSEEERLLMYSRVAGYMNDLKKTQTNIIEDVQTAFTTENARRRGEGKTELVCPSRMTIRAAIHQLDPFRVKLTRDGKDAARRAFSPVGQGIDVERPLQRVEMDEQKIDLISLMGDSGLLNFMTGEEKRSLGLDDTKKRWWMTAAIDVRTRCIVGMTLSRTPTAQSGLHTIEMATRDKGIWANALGAEDPWDQGGLIGTLITDCGKQFTGPEFRARAYDLGINVLHTPAAAPWLKPYIERVFRTFSTRLMPRLSGCTFGDIIRRGTSNPEDKAALAVDDLCAVLVRWIVDIYHNTPHEGLNGETPSNCWRRLTEQFGVTPPPSLSRRSLVFGQEIERTLQKDGLTVLGVRYHAEKLAAHFAHGRDMQMPIRWYPEDIGAIWVKVGDEWCPVNAVHNRYRGVSAMQWLVASRELRAHYAREAEVKMSTVARALDFVERQNGEAMRRVSVVQQDWTPERIDREDRLLSVGFTVSDDEDDGDEVVEPDEWGTSLPTAGDSASKVSVAVEKNLETACESFSAEIPSIQFHECQAAPSFDDDGDDDDMWLGDK